MKTASLLFLTCSLISFNIFAKSTSFDGGYKLIETIEGHCVDSLELQSGSVDGKKFVKILIDHATDIITEANVSKNQNEETKTDYVYAVQGKVSSLEAQSSDKYASALGYSNDKKKLVLSNDLQTLTYTDSRNEVLLLAVAYKVMGGSSNEYKNVCKYDRN